MKNEFDYLNDVKMDYSKYPEIELTDLEREKMKKTNINKKIKVGRVAGLVAIAASIAIFSQTAFAQNMIASIIKTASTGHNQFYQTDTSQLEIKMPKAFKGLLFDEKGKEAKTYSTSQTYYDKSGNKIDDVESYLDKMVDDGTEIEFVSEDGKTVSETKHSKNNDFFDSSRENGYPIVYNIDEIDGNLCFKSKLPDYLPEGFKFYGATAYGDEYLFAYYTKDNGDYIMVHERIINEETQFSSSTDGKIEEIKINGYDAVLMDGKSIDWEADGISIGVSVRGKLPDGQLVRVAESVK